VVKVTKARNEDIGLSKAVSHLDAKWMDQEDQYSWGLNNNCGFANKNKVEPYGDKTTKGAVTLLVDFSTGSLSFAMNGKAMG